MDSIKHILVLGPSGTFSHEAAESLFPNADVSFAPNFDMLFDQLESDGGIGLVPIENSQHGSVDEVLDRLVQTSVCIWQTKDFEICYAFGASDPNDVQTVASHPQALAQCRLYLKEHYPLAERFPVSSTAYAIDLASADPTMGVVASKKALNESNLTIVAEDIEPQHNTTRFAVVSKTDPFPKSERNQMGIVFHPTADRPGLLHDILDSFKRNTVNLTRIENRPTGEKLGDYLFFLNFEGTPSDPRIQATLAEFEAIPEIEIVKILGKW